MKHKSETHAMIIAIIVLLGLILGINLVGNNSNENFTIVVLPDTQGYSKWYPWLFDSQTQWIVDNKEALNIVFVTQLGDLVDQTDNLTQWENANRSMSKLDDSVPWAVLPGNHDMFGDNLTNYDMYFGYGRFSGKSWHGGTYETGDNANSYELFSAGGSDYLIFHLQYDPNDDVLFWASNVIDQYPARRVIVSTHDYLVGFTKLGQRSEIGERIWHSLIRPHADQIFLVLCGHSGAEDMIADTVNGHVVYQMLADYQNLTIIESGWLRLLQFYPQQHEIIVKTYSPYLNKYKTDPESDFTLDYNTTSNAKVIPASPAAEGTIYIRADGSVEPSTTPIQHAGNVYTFTGDIRGSMVVERSDVVVDGAGFTLQGTGADDYRPSYEPFSYLIQMANATEPWKIIPPDPYVTPDSNNTGIYSCAENLTIKNLRITEFWCGIEIEYSTDNCIVENEITNNAQGVWIHQSSNDAISGNTVSSNKAGIILTAAHDNVYGNTIVNNSEYGIKLEWSFNSISGNNIENNCNSVSIENTYANYSYSNFWNDDKKGNYWSDYESRYPNAAELDNTGVWNTPYVIDENNQDNHPLIKPVTIPADDEPSLIPTLILIAVPTAAAVAVGLAIYRQKRKNPASNV